MLMNIRRRFALTALALLLAALAPVCGSSSSAQAQDAAKTTYEDHVRAIFRNRCFNCHNQNKAESDLALDGFGALMQGGASGTVITPGDLAGSRLWLLVNHEDSPSMPPEADKLPAEELAVIKAWIEGGALENSGSKVMVKKPMVDLTATAGASRPEGPPPMPGFLPKSPIEIVARPGAVTALAASPWAPLVAVSGYKQVLLYNSDSGRLLGVLPFPEGVPHVLRFSRSGTLLLAGGGRASLLGKVVVFDVKTGQRVFEVGDELDVVLAADINENHTLIALGGPKKIVRVYSTADSSLVYEIKKHTDWIHALEFSPDGVLLASGDRSGGLFVWESDTGREYANLQGHQGAINDVSWRLDSNILASASEDTLIKLWEMNNGGQVGNWGAHGGGAASVEFTHDGRLVSTGRDRVTKVWDQNGAAQRNFEALPDIGLESAFTHDGQRVVAGGWSGDVNLWNAADGVLVTALSQNPPPLEQQLEAANQLLAAAQAEAKTAADAYAAAQAAADKAAADLAAAEKAVADNTTLLANGQNALKAAQDALAAAGVELAAAQKVEADLTAAIPLLTESAAKAKSAADATGDAELAAIVAKLEELIKARAVQLEAAKVTAAEKAALVETAKGNVAAAEKQVADYAAALKTAQDQVTALAPGVKPAADAAAAAKIVSDAAAAKAAAAQQEVTLLQDDIARSAKLKELNDKLAAAQNAAAQQDALVAAAQAAAATADAALKQAQADLAAAQTADTNAKAAAAAAAEADKPAADAAATAAAEVLVKQTAAATAAQEALNAATAALQAAQAAAAPAQQAVEAVQQEIAALQNPPAPA